MIHIIDYGAGNLGSIVNMINFIGGEAILTNDPTEIENAEKLILPGVGHFDHGMNKLIKSNLIPILNDKVLNKNTPILGICLGAQMMCEKSEEGDVPGLGWFKADVKKFDANLGIRIPHMGWNYVEAKKNTTLSKVNDEEQRFYFVHSYYMNAHDQEDVLFETNYGTNFASGLNKNNIYACQFHPEKSHKYGISLMKKFLSL